MYAAMLHPIESWIVSENENSLSVHAEIVEIQFLFYFSLFLHATVCPTS